MESSDTPNQAIINGDFTDPNPTNNTATDDTIVLPDGADLSVTKTDGLVWAFPSCRNSPTASS